MFTKEANSFWQNQFNAQTNQPNQNFISPLQTNNNNNNTKRKFVKKNEFFKNKKQRGEGGIAFKKPKAPKIPVYNATVQPAQLLHEV